MIEAGTRENVKWDGGNWVFLDIGFSHEMQTCGLLVGNGDPSCIRFGEAEEAIVSRAKQSLSPMNLVIEAPLFVCFDCRGNPKGRFIIERDENRTRYWYTGAGCAVMVAAMYMIRRLYNECPLASVRLFEGFVSYKDRSGPSDHGADVRLLREVVRHPDRNCIISPEQLKNDQSDNDNLNDNLVSAFSVAGIDCGVPVVLKPVKC